MTVMTQSVQIVIGVVKRLGKKWCEVVIHKELS